MFDLGSLDIIISIVVVLLVLSLIVQSIQSLLKKILKLKSTIVFGSMEDLFKYINTEQLVEKTPKQLVADVTAQFKELGRVSLILRRPMLDSISKGDLQKILQRLHGDKLKADVENWFDTVMQSFEERYTRHMKTLGLIVSFAVVIVLNANFFNIYRNIAESDIKRAAILQKGEALLNRLSQQEKAAADNQNKQEATSKPKETPAPEPTPAEPASSPAGTATPTSASPPAGAATPTPVQSPPAEANKTQEQTKQEIKQNAQEIQAYVNDYKGLGFTPLRPQQVSDFVQGQGPWAKTPPEQRFVHALKVLLGWTIMALLLSVGAPFWQDTLESLFGLKTLIRKKNQSQNVEDKPGEGNPKT